MIFPNPNVLSQRLGFLPEIIKADAAFLVFVDSMIRIS